MTIFAEDRETAVFTFDSGEEYTEEVLRDEPKYIPIGDSIDWKFYDAALKSAIVQHLRQTGTPASEMAGKLREYEAELQGLMRAMDISKFRTLEALFDRGDIRAHIDIEYLSGDSALLSSYNAMHINASQISIADAIRDLAHLPMNALRTPALDRYYYKSYTKNDAERRAVEGNLASNTKAEMTYLRDLEAAYPEAARSITELHDRYRRENEEIARLEKASAAAADKLLKFQTESESRQVRGLFARFRHRREEKSLIKAYKSARVNIREHLEELSAAEEKLFSEGKITQYTLDTRRAQLEERDFTFMPMQTENQSRAVGQRTYAECLAGEEVTGYDRLTANERSDVISSSLLIEADEIYLKNEELINGVRGNGELSPKELSQLMEKAQKNVALATEYKLAAEKDSFNKSMQMAINKVEAMKSGTDDPEIKKTLGELLEREAMETNRLLDYHKRIADMDIALAGYDTAIRVGGKEKVFSRDRVAGLEKLAEDRESLKAELESYTAELIANYVTLLDAGVISQKFCDDKLLSLEAGGIDGCILATVEPSEDLATLKNGLGAVALEEKVPEVTNKDILKDKSRHADKAREDIARRVSEKMVSGDMSRSQLQRFVKEIEAESKKALALQRDADRSVRAKSLIEADARIESVRKATPDLRIIGAAMEAYDRESDDMNAHQRYTRAITNLEQGLVGYRVAVELGREGDLYTPEEIEQFKASEDELALKIQARESFKEGLIASYRDLGERGVLDSAYVEARIEDIKADFRSGMTMAEHSPIGDPLTYLERQGGREQPVRTEEPLSEAVNPETGVTEAEQTAFTGQLLSMTRGVRRESEVKTADTSVQQQRVEERLADGEPVKDGDDFSL